MLSMCKICFFVSLVTLAFCAFTLAGPEADIHEGTGQLMGTTTYACGDCQNGGDSCNASDSSNCSWYDPPNCGNGHCADSCPGTQGRVCSESSAGGVMCGDGAGSCPDSARDKCKEGTDSLLQPCCYCESSETETVDCGDAYNKCLTP